MANFCGKCGAQHNFPMSSVRSSRRACDFCGGFDKMQAVRDGVVVRETNLPNYSYPDHLLPTVVESVGEDGN